VSARPRPWGAVLATYRRGEAAFIRAKTVRSFAIVAGSTGTKSRTGDLRKLRQAGVPPEIVAGFERAQGVRVRPVRREPARRVCLAVARADHRHPRHRRRHRAGSARARVRRGGSRGDPPGSSDGPPAVAPTPTSSLSARIPQAAAATKAAPLPWLFRVADAFARSHDWRVLALDHDEVQAVLGLAGEAAPEHGRP